MKARVLIGAAVATLLAATLPSHAETTAGATWKARPATYGVHVTKDVPIVMSDGIVLRANVYRPARADGRPAPGRFPTLLVQTPYNKEQQDPHSDYFVQRGYVDVVVDIRGTGSSGGAFRSFDARSQTDSFEAVQWAATQPWSTGRVGLHGSSHFAINQLLTAAQQPPALKAIAPVVPTGDNYRTVFPGGYLTSLFAFAVLNSVNGTAPPSFTTSDPLAAFENLASKPENVAIISNYLASTMLGGSTAYDGPYYRGSSPLWVIDRIKTPTLLAGGWNDALSQRDVPLMLQELQKRKVPVRMLMGPWFHTNPGEGLQAAGLASLDEQQLRWFDHYVLGKHDAALLKQAPVTYQRLGESRYLTAKTWPVPGTPYTRLALSGDGALVKGTGSGPADVLPWNPTAGVCSRSTAVGTFGLAPSTPCAENNAPNDATGLTYDFPVTKDLDLTGSLAAHLYVSSSQADAFVTLHVEDVDPTTGVATQLTSGWDSLSFRKLDSARTTKLGNAGIVPFHPYTEASVEQITPNQVYDWWVEIRPIAARIPKGHLLRLSITTADAVRFIPTAAALGRSRGAVLTVHHDRQRPSTLIIPGRP